MIKVLLMHHNQAIRSGLRSVIDPADDITVMGEADNLSEALSLVKSEKPDLLIMDAALPNITFEDAVRQLRLLHPRLRLLIFSAAFDPGQWLQLLKVGVRGCLLHCEDLSLLVGAIREAAKGAGWLSPEAMNRMTMWESNIFPDPVPSGVQLSDQEKRVIRLVAEGLSDQQIAEVLRIGDRTVRDILKRIRDKIGVYSRVAIAVWAVKHGLANPLC